MVLGHCQTNIESKRKNKKKEALLCSFQNWEATASYHWLQFWHLLLLFILIWTVFPAPVIQSYTAPLISTERHTRRSQYNSKSKVKKGNSLPITKTTTSITESNTMTTNQPKQRGVIPSKSSWIQRRKRTYSDNILICKFPHPHPF